MGVTYGSTLWVWPMVLLCGCGLWFYFVGVTHGSTLFVGVAYGATLWVWPIELN